MSVDRCNKLMVKTRSISCDLQRVFIIDNASS